jgi:hypothetical protein
MAIDEQIYYGHEREREREFIENMLRLNQSPLLFLGHQGVHNNNNNRLGKHAQ